MEWIRADSQANRRLFCGFSTTIAFILIIRFCLCLVRGLSYNRVILSLFLRSGIRYTGALVLFNGLHLGDPFVVRQDLEGFTSQLGVIHV